MGVFDMPKKKTLKGRFLQTGLLMLVLSLAIAGILAKSIRNIHDGSSVSALF